MLFKKIMPDLIVIVTIHGVFHRWVMYIADSMGIPVFFAPHGTKLKGTGASGEKKSLGHKVSRALFYISDWIYIFKDSVRMNFKGFYEILRTLFEFYFNKSRFSDNPKTSWGLKLDTIFLNYKEEEEFFRGFLNLENSNETQFIVSGNLLGDSEIVNSKNFDSSINNSEVLYVSQPLVGSGFINIDQQISFFEKICTVLKKNDKQLIFRPHPRDDKLFLKYAEDNSIPISQNLDFSEDLQKYNYFIGFFSAGLFSSSRSGKPTLSLEIEGIPKFPYISENKKLLQYAFEDIEMGVNALINSNVDEKSVHDLKPASLVISETIKNAIK